MRSKASKYLLTALWLVLTVASASAGDPEQPNVIIVLTDDQGYADLSCHGNPYLDTPHLDQLSNEGVRFTDFHVDPTCSPTRAALMTGKYSSRVGVWLTYASRHHLRKDELTMADAFRNNGYRTAIFGKWHLGDNYPFRPNDRGFEESFVHGGGVVGETPDFWDNNYYNDVYFRNGVPEKADGYCTDVWFSEAKRFISENKSKPFFIYLSTNAAHAPFHVPEAYATPYRENAGGRASFYGMISNIDENIGRLREYLIEEDLEDNTIFIFLNDNGTAGGVKLEGIAGDSRNGWEVGGYNAGMRGRKSSVYEGGHRAACFMHWPNGKLTGGKDVEGLTSHIDLLPTLVDLCGLEMEAKPEFDGISLKKAIKKGKVKSDRCIMVHHQGRFGTAVGEAPLIKYKDYSVMKDSWRLVGDELYNLENDPGQRTNVAPGFPEIVAELSGEYETWWDAVTEQEDVFCPFVLNPNNQKTLMISTQNLLGDDVAYNQRHIRAAEKVNGWTYIDVEIPGSYTVSLRRWPRESQLGINENAAPYPLEHGKHRMKDLPTRSIRAVEARLKFGSFNQSSKIKSGAEEIMFTADLEKGLHRFQSWFVLERGDSITAYYAYIEPSKEPEVTEIAKEQPNIILYFIDDLGWSYLGYRNPDVFESPNIDQLAYEGLDFQQMYIPSPTCSPSRSTLLTGKHPARLKMVRHISDNPKSARLIYDSEGRNTHHLWLKDPAQFPSKQWVDLEHTSYAEALGELGYYNLFLGKWHLGNKEYHPVKQGFDHQIGTTDRGAPSNYYPDYFKDEDVLEDVEDRYLTDLLTDSIVDFLENYDRDQPFMVSFWSYNVHTPHIGRKDLVEHFESKGLEGRHAHLSAMVRSVDMSLGKVRKALSDNGLDQNTIIIFLSDQGGYFDNPPFHGGKRFDTLYEGGARVPFVVYWPGVTNTGDTNNSVVQSTDLFPTLVEIAGGDPSQYEDLDGVSLHSVIQKNCELERGAPIFGYRAYEDLYASVRYGDWKLLAYRSGLLKLYNIADDIAEQNDLAASYPEKVEKLKKKLITWEKEMQVEEYSGVQ